MVQTIIHYRMHDLLRKLQFSDKEVTVYLALLERGPSSLRSLAQTTALNRGTVYNALKSLMTRGVVSFHDSDKRQHFIAENPETLLREARQQESVFKSTISELETAIPELQSRYNDASEKPKVRYFEGMKGARTVLDDLLSTLKEGVGDKQYIVYSASDLRDFLYQCYPEFTDKRIKAGITVDVISTGPGGRLCGLDHRKWIAGDRFVGHTYILVYADRVAYITQQKKKVVSVLIENQHIADTHRFLFRELWQLLP